MLQVLGMEKTEKSRRVAHNNNVFGHSGHRSCIGDDEEYDVIVVWSHKFQQVVSAV